MFAFKNRKGLEKLEELGSLQIQVNILQLQDKLGKQDFHWDMKQFY